MKKVLSSIDIEHIVLMAWVSQSGRLVQGVARLFLNTWKKLPTT
jgi:hypothetical protein